MHGCLGRGGHGEVYRATMWRVGGVTTEVAVKVLAVDVDPKSDPVHRLRDEGRLLGAVNHPVILKVYDLVALAGRVALVSEYIEGEDLHHCIYPPDHSPPQTIPPRTLVEIVGHLAEGLDAAANSPSPDGRGPMGLVHRDVKPQNVRVGIHGQIKLLDFGIARAASHVEREGQTQNDVLMGSWPYLSPERLIDEAIPATSAVDIYGLGCILFEGLAGERLMEGSSLFELYRIVDHAGDFSEMVQGRLDDLADRAPAGILTLLHQLLAEDPHRRPSAGQVAQLCEDLAEQLPGPGVRRWTRERVWCETVDRPGPLTDRDLTEGTLSRPTRPKIPPAAPTGPRPTPGPVDPVAQTVIRWEEDEDELQMPNISSIVIDDPDAETIQTPVRRKSMRMGLAAIAMGLSLLGVGLLGLAGLVVWVVFGGVPEDDGGLAAGTPATMMDPSPAEEGAAIAPDPAPVDPAPPDPVPAVAAPVPVPSPVPAAPSPDPVPSPVPAAPSPDPVPAPDPVPVIVVETPVPDPVPAPDPVPVIVVETPVPDPVVEAPEPAPTTLPILSVDGDAVVELRGDFGDFRLGTPLITGVYRVWADFGGGMIDTTLTTEARQGGSVKVSCSVASKKCFVNPKL